MIELILIPGDIIRRRKGPVWHWGVWLPSGVLHNTPEEGEHTSTLAKFRDGKPIEIFRPHDINRNEIIHRAYSIASHPSSYQYLWRNCEHTINEITTDEAHSPTVKSLGLLVLAAVAVYAAAKYR